MYVQCRHNLLAPAHRGPKSSREPTDESCSLDVAARGEHTHEQIAVILGVSKQAIDCAEKSALKKLARNAAARRLEK